jgi:hypothetical protein
MMFVKKGNAEYRIIEQRLPSFLASFQVYINGSGGNMMARSLWYIATPWRCLATAPLDRFGRDKLLHRRFPNFLDRALPSLWHRRGAQAMRKHPAANSMRLTVV